MHGSNTTGLLDRMSALADALRGRLLLLLERRELTVSELCSVLQLPQSTVSRHLKTLSEAGWVAQRPDGTRRMYRMSVDLDPEAQGLWRLTRSSLAASPAASRDGDRLASVLAERRSRSRQFFESASARWDSLRDELFGPRSYLAALAGLMDPDRVLGDLGCGSGPLSEALAPFVRQIVAVDDSEAMLDAARQRLSRFPNVDLRRGDLEVLPIDDGALDAATLVLVLHHLPDPPRVVHEVARVLRPGGSLLIVDMQPHERERYRQEMGHLWLGFEPERVAGYLLEAGFDAPRIVPLAPDPAAKGPALFAARALRRN